MKLVKCRPHAFTVFGAGSRAGICFRKPGEKGTSRRDRLFHPHLEVIEGSTNSGLRKILDFL